MGISREIKSQIERAYELLNDLENSVDGDLLSQNVSDRTRNLTQELLIKIRRFMDQSFRRFFEKHYLSCLTETNKEVKLYFPITDRKEDLKSQLGLSKMADLEYKHPTFYAFLDSIQPYNKNYDWLKYLRKYSNEGHIKLTPQTIAQENETILGNCIKAGRGARVLMKNCLVNGVPVDSENINESPLESFDPRLNVKRITWVSLRFLDTDIDVLSLCKQSTKEAEKIIEEVFNFF